MINVPQKEIPLTEVRKNKLMIGTPMYGGQCTGTFAKSMIDLTVGLTQMGVPFVPYFLFNESLITRARNYVSSVFMNSDCTHLMFIDSDIGFNAKDVVDLMVMSSLENNPGNEFDIIGGPYPKKCISWEKIVAAVNQGKGDADPNELGKYVGDYVFNPKGGAGRIPLNQPVEVLEIGTGFMMIRRQTFEKFKEAFPQYEYRPDHIRTAEFDGSKKIMQYFQAEIDPKSERYLSEDYWFTQKIQEIGLKCWLCPWMEMTHSGFYIFGGSLGALASIGASPTANPEALKKTAPTN